MFQTVMVFDLWWNIDLCISLHFVMSVSHCHLETGLMWVKVSIKSHNWICFQPITVPTGIWFPWLYKQTLHQTPTAGHQVCRLNTIMKKMNLIIGGKPQYYFKFNLGQKILIICMNTFVESMTQTCGQIDLLIFFSGVTTVCRFDARGVFHGDDHGAYCRHTRQRPFISETAKSVQERASNSNRNALDLLQYRFIISKTWTVGQS